MPGIEHGRQVIVGAQFFVVYDAQLFLAERLARIELNRADAGLARIRRELRARESEGILYARRLDHIGHHRQFRCIAGCETQLRIEIVALGVAVKSITVGLKVRGVDHVVDGAVVSLGLQSVALSIESPVLRRTVDEMPGFRVFGEDRDHAARRIAVQRRERSPQYFDVIGGPQVELRKLTLTVGHGAGNAVGI